MMIVHSLQVDESLACGVVARMLVEELSLDCHMTDGGETLDFKVSER
jgi:hypothetical protein